MGGCVHVTIKRERVLIQKEKEQGQVMKYVCPKKGGGIWGEERGGAEEWDTNTSIKHINSQGIPTFCNSVKKLD